MRSWDDRHVSVNDLSRKNLLREIDESLARLRTDYIDIYQLHWPDPRTPIEETAQALVEIKKAGKIRHVGLSNFSQKDVETFMTMVDIDCQQGLYNMLERNTSSYHGIPLAYRTEREMIPTVLKYGQAFLPYSPLFQGLLAGRFNGGIPFSARDIRNENPQFGPDHFPKNQAAALKRQRCGRDGKAHGADRAELARQNRASHNINGWVLADALQKNIDTTGWDIADEYMAMIAN